LDETARIFEGGLRVTLSPLSFAQSPSAIQSEDLTRVKGRIKSGMRKVRRRRDYKLEVQEEERVRKH